MVRAAGIPVESRRRVLREVRWRIAAFLLAPAAACLPSLGHAAAWNLAAVSCAKYENEVLASGGATAAADPIDTVMWLFGFSIAKSGERVMYGDSLRAFGFALDAECKNNPTVTVLQAVTTVQSKRDNPMDLTRLDCVTFEKRHAALRVSDPESATTLTMWMFGFAAGLADNHVLDADLVHRFDAGLEDHCAKHPQDSLFDALSAPNPAVPGPRPAKTPAVRQH